MKEAGGGLEKEVSKEAISGEGLFQSDPTGTTEHNLYHRGSLTFRQRAGLLYLISVSRWLWAGLWRGGIEV